MPLTTKVRAVVLKATVFPMTFVCLMGVMEGLLMFPVRISEAR